MSTHTRTHSSTGMHVHMFIPAHKQKDITAAKDRRQHIRKPLNKGNNCNKKLQDPSIKTDHSFVAEELSDQRHSFTSNLYLDI